MKVSCQACGAKYTIADDKVRGRKVKIRCKSCGTPMVVDGQSEAPAPAAAGAPAAAAGEAAPAGGAVSWSVNLSDTDQRTMTTEEIVAGWQAGVVTSDAFVWKDGMGDWVAVLEHADLKGPLAAATNAPGGPTPFGPTIVTAPTESARLASAPRGAGVDLFDASGGSTEEEDVATSAPALPQAGSTAYDDGKMTGARNENSVLFSLDALKGGLTAEPKKTSGAAAPARKAPASAAAASAASSDPFAMSPAELGAPNPLFSLNTNQALLTAPAAPEPPPQRFDATGTPVAQPMNKVLVYGGGAAAAVILLLLGLLLGRSGTKEGPAPEGSAKEQAAATTSAESEKKPDTKPEEKPAEKPAETATPTASAAPSAAPTSTGSKPVAVGGGKPSSGTGTGSGSGSTATKPTATAKPEEMPSAGSAPFSVSAAQVALTQAAGNAASCAKPAGPTGSGKVQVTFATSGRVTTANVAGPPFAGTPIGGCVAGVFRKARIPAFSGNPVTVSKSFNIR